MSLSVSFSPAPFGGLWPPALEGGLSYCLTTISDFVVRLASLRLWIKATQPLRESGFLPESLDSMVSHGFLDAIAGHSAICSSLAEGSEVSAIGVDRLQSERP